MPKVTLNRDDFKVLASETRLEVIKALDGKRLSLNDIARSTNLHKMTLHEHLAKLVETGYVKRYEREGHKWVYYKLSWKGESLLHPENTRIVVLFSATFVTFFFGFSSLIGGWVITPYRPITFGPAPGQDPIFLFATICCFLLFSILLTVTLWRYRINKTPKL